MVAGAPALLEGRHEDLAEIVLDGERRPRAANRHGDGDLRVVRAEGPPSGRAPRSAFGKLTNEERAVLVLRLNGLRCE